MARNNDESLKSIGFSEKALGYSCTSIKLVTIKHIRLINMFISKFHELYTNKNCKHFLENVEKRIAAEEDLAYRKLQLLGYSDYFLIVPLPVGIEHHVGKLNGNDEEIGEVMFRKVKQQAIENDITYEEMQKKVQYHC